MEKKATQYWLVEDYDERLEGLVNGRYTYWQSQSAIPGGIAFENFELKTPFRQEDTFIFGIAPVDPATFIESLKNM